MFGLVSHVTLLNGLIFVVSTTFNYIWSLTALAYHSHPMYQKEQHEHSAKHLFLRYTEETPTGLEHESE